MIVCINHSNSIINLQSIIIFLQMFCTDTFLAFFFFCSSSLFPNHPLFIWLRSKLRFWIELAIFLNILHDLNNSFSKWIPSFVICNHSLLKWFLHLILQLGCMLFNSHDSACIKIGTDFQNMFFSF